MTQPLRFNPAIQTWPFDGAAKEPMLMCEVPRADGSAARFVVPARLVELLRRCDGSRPEAQVLREHAPAHGYGPDEVEKLLATFLAPRGILVAEGAAPVEKTGKTADRLSYLTFRMKLLPPALVTPVARLLGWLFAAPVMAVMLLAVVAAHVVFYFVAAPAAGIGLADLKGSHVAGVLGIMVASTVFHELGHAAAAARFGCRRLEIGWGLYYYMTVLYTDLSEAWRLPRRQRALIDVGGIYFQAVLAVFLLAWHLATGDRVALYAFLATDLAIAASLNPFFRMDGYWLMSDLLGVPNLHAQVAGLPRWAALRLFGRREPAPVSVGRGGLALLTAYSVLGLAFFVFTFQFVLRRLVMAVMDQLPHAASTLWTQATTTPLHLGALGLAVLAVAWRSLVLFGTAKFVWTFLTRMAAMVWGVIRALRRAWREQRPRYAAG